MSGQVTQRSRRPAPGPPPVADPMVPARDSSLAGRKGAIYFVGVPFALWCLVLASGTVAGTVEQGGERYLPFAWFDRWLRVAGPLFPLPIFLLRWLVEAKGSWAQPCRPALRNPPLIALYTFLTLARLVTYGAHVLIAGAGSGAAHLMSDHILLALSVSSVLQVEAFCLLPELRGDNPSPGGGYAAVGGGEEASQRRASEMCAGSAVQGRLLAAVLVLLLLLMGDMFCTARYFHTAHEVAVSAALGGALFQLPAGVWIARFTM